MNIIGAISRMVFCFIESRCRTKAPRVIVTTKKITTQKYAGKEFVNTLYAMAADNGTPTTANTLRKALA